MTPREKFIAALTGKEIKGHVPHFELVFFLTLEAIGKLHPSHRYFGQWDQMSSKERDLQYKDIAETYVMVADKYKHSAIFVQNSIDDFNNIVRITEKIREISGNKYFIMCHGDATHAIPDGNSMLDYSVRLVEEPEEILAEQMEGAKRLAEAYDKVAAYNDKLIDGICMCSDYCLNDGPFWNPTMFEELIAPPLAKEIELYRERGLYTIKHTDGNIMPILDAMIECKPDAFHSLDPQGGVDIAKIKKICGDKITLIGNVNCGLLQTGTLEEAAASTRYALQNGMPGGRYIFSTSNCVYTGLDLDRYEYIWNIWRNEGIYE